MSNEVSKIYTDIANFLQRLCGKSQVNKGKIYATFKFL